MKIVWSNTEDKMVGITMFQCQAESGMGVEYAKEVVLGDPYPNDVMQPFPDPCIQRQDPS